MAAKKARVLEALRVERGVAAPDAPKADAKAEEQATAASAAPPADPMEEFKREYHKKEQDLLSLKEQADSRIQAAAEKEALAAKKLEKMEQALESPLEFIAETGMTEKQWMDFLAGGGKLTPEQQRVRALEKSHGELIKQIEDLNKSMAERETQAQQKAELSQIEQMLQKYPLVNKLGGAPNVHQTLQKLREQNPQVTIQQCLDHLDTGYKVSIRNLLSEKEIGAMFAPSVPKPTTTSSAEQHQSPSTLTKQVSSSTDASPTTPGPLDWAGKRALALRRLAQERQLA